ncbi:hypothetical protein LXL04_038914 [Taraxacum kok-saghyz]
MRKFREKEEEIKADLTIDKLENNNRDVMIFLVSRANNSLESSLDCFHSRGPDIWRGPGRYPKLPCLQSRRLNKLVQTRTNYENENARTNVIHFTGPPPAPTTGPPPDPPDHHLHPPPDHRRTTVGPPSVHHLHPSAHWTTDAPPPDHRRTTVVPPPDHHSIGNQNVADL